MSYQRILYIGSYWQGSNDIVNLMRRSLTRMPGVDVVTFDPRIYELTPSPFIVRNGHVNWLSDETVHDLVNQHNPTLLICNAGGLSPTPAMHQHLGGMGIRRIGIALSDPDDFPQRSRHFAGLFDLFYTNTVKAMAQYSAIDVEARLLPFAADPTFHRPLEGPKICDVVIVGGKRPERIGLVKALRESGLRVKCHGRGWRGHLLERLGFSSEVHGEDHIKAINSGVVYLSFAATRAGFTNVKVGIFEAAACGACILVEDFEELHRYFEPGYEIITYQCEADAIAQAQRLCEAPEEARRIGEAALKRLMSEHTWEHRWHKVLKDLSEL